VVSRGVKGDFIVSFHHFTLFPLFHCLLLIVLERAIFKRIVLKGWLQKAGSKIIRLAVTCQLTIAKQ